MLRGASTTLSFKVEQGTETDSLSLGIREERTVSASFVASEVLLATLGSHYTEDFVGVSLSVVVASRCFVFIC